jgi:hypothetical protein
MAGMINLSLTQQLDEFGEPLSGGQLYIIQAGTVSTPQNAYQDEALTIPTTNPIVLDAAGRIPQFFLADGQIKVRLQDAMGVVKFVADNLLVIGPSTSGGGGGGGSVDPTTVLQTGDIKIRYDTAILTGFVRLNGLTIGSSTSGATELADPTAQALFQYLWQTDPYLPVSGGRGATSIADWTANKRLTLPDGRARLLTALDGMGNSLTGLLNYATFIRGNVNILGSYGGAYARAIPTSALPSHRHNMYVSDPGHSHTVNVSVTSVMANAAFGGSLSGYSYVLANGTTTSVNTTGVYVSDGAGNVNQTTAVGGGSTMDMTPAFLLITVYMKV